MKHLFELMQMQEIATNNFLPSKKEIILSSEQFANNLIQNGEHDKLEMFSQVVRIKEAVNTIHDAIKESLPREKQIAYGIEINPVNGRQMIQFSEDEVWQKLNADLKAREELLKLALKQDLIDAYGNDVPKVSVKFASDSLNIKY
jgi:hypothetical protein